MAVLPLEALPLGFRFRPTDEELVSHYLKRKITGEIRGEREVIPEIDVCKCEPWDLPDKSLIRSDDPEWFFFAPKDRKYPNGSRSNRATEKGYWKATGKDRIIKSRGPPRQQHMIGMKKTLVFHKGRAPRGERTHWIMHEYRTTEPEFDSGDQGGYVLYKLFRKSEDSSRISDEAGPTNLDEVDRSGHSPAPSRSSPDADVIQADADVVEEITAPVLQKRPAGLGNGDKVPVNAAQNQVQDLRSQFFNANNNDSINNNINNNNDINNINNDIKEENNLSVDINDYLNLFFMNLPNDESPHQLSDCPPIDNNNFDNNNVNNNDNSDEIWDGVNIDDILMNVTSDTEDQNNNNNNYNLSNYENAPPLPYDCSDPDVVSFDSSPDPFQDMFNTLEESSVVQNQNYFAQSNFNTNIINNSINNNINNEGTGIMIRPHQQMMTSAIGQNEDTGINIRTRGFNNDYVNVGRQGEASRRMRLQTSLKIGTCLPCEKNEDEEEKLEEDNTSDADSAESIVIDKLEESSVHDDDDSPKRSDKIEEIEDTNEAEIKTLITPQTVTKKRGLFGYFAISVIIILVAILCSLYNNDYNYVVNHV